MRTIWIIVGMHNNCNPWVVKSEQTGDVVTFENAIQANLWLEYHLGVAKDFDPSNRYTIEAIEV